MPGSMARPPRDSCPAGRRARSQSIALDRSHLDPSLGDASAGGGGAERKQGTGDPPEDHRHPAPLPREQTGGQGQEAGAHRAPVLDSPSLRGWSRLLRGQRQQRELQALPGEGRVRLGPLPSPPASQREPGLGPRRRALRPEPRGVRAVPCAAHRAGQAIELRIARGGRWIPRRRAHAGAGARGAVRVAGRDRGGFGAAPRHWFHRSLEAVQVPRGSRGLPGPRGPADEPSVCGGAAGHPRRHGAVQLAPPPLDDGQGRPNQQGLLPPLVHDHRACPWGPLPLLPAGPRPGPPDRRRRPLLPLTQRRALQTFRRLSEACHARTALLQWCCGADAEELPGWQGRGRVPDTPAGTCSSRWRATAGSPPTSWCSG